MTTRRHRAGVKERQARRRHRSQGQTNKENENSRDSYSKRESETARIVVKADGGGEMQATIARRKVA